MSQDKSSGQLLVRAQEANRELYARYQSLQDELIEAYESGSWQAVAHLVEQQKKRQPIEQLRFSEIRKNLPKAVVIDDSGIHKG